MFARDGTISVPWTSLFLETTSVRAYLSLAAGREVPMNTLSRVLRTIISRP
jgi:hypothetical protein